MTGKPAGRRRLLASEATRKPLPRPVARSIQHPVHGDRMINFTEKGRKRAEDIIRRHRLARKLFMQTFRVVDEQEVAEQACRFEHILSPEATDSICRSLGIPGPAPTAARFPPENAA